jgi:hypothetical protein
MHAKRQKDTDREEVWRQAVNSNSGFKGDGLLKAFCGTRVDMMSKVKELGLPHIPFVALSVDEALEGDTLQRKVESELSGHRFFWVIQSDKSGKYLCDPAKGTTLKELRQKLESFHSRVTNGEKYEVMIGETAATPYLGSITVNRDNEVVGEITRFPNPPTRCVGRVCTFLMEPHLRTIKYSIYGEELQQDEGFKKAIVNTITSIPHYDSGHHAKYKPGYYEYCFKQMKGSLAPAFLEVRNVELLFA